MSYREKSAWGSLIITGCLFGYYLLEVTAVVVSGSADAASRMPYVVWGVVVTAIVVEVVYHVLIAIGGRADAVDERDRLIEAKATQLSYVVLMVGCFHTVGHLMFASHLPDAAWVQVIQMPFMPANFLLLSMLLAEMSGFAGQVYFYRRGM